MKNNLLDKCAAQRLAARRAKFTRRNRGGAPKGNCNALKTGRHTAAMKGLRHMVRARLKRARAAMREVAR